MAQAAATVVGGRILVNQWPVVAPVLEESISAAVLGLNELLTFMRAVFTSVVAHNGDKLDFCRNGAVSLRHFLGAADVWSLVLALKPILPN